MTTTFTTKLAYNAACDKLAAWEKIIEATDALDAAIRSAVVEKHIDEGDGQIMTGSLSDWLSDREGDNDITDLRDAIVLWDHQEEAA